MGRAVPLLFFALWTVGCGSTTHLVVELAADTDTPIDFVSLMVLGDDEETLLAEGLAVQPAEALPLTVVLEPSDDVPENLTLEVEVFAGEQAVAEGGGSGSFVRGAINELTLELQVVSQPGL
ncbi:MAG: hypothetical protein AAFP04_07405 [Myxococcota bacterium]